MGKTKLKGAASEPDYRNLWVLERAREVWPDAIRVRERGLGDEVWELVVETPSFHDTVVSVKGPQASRAAVAALEAMGEKERPLAPLQRVLEQADREQRDLAFVDGDAAFELVERELIEAGVKLYSFQYMPKNDVCAVGSCYHGGPFTAGTLKWIVATFTPRKLAAEKYHADELARKRRERAEQGSAAAAGDEEEDGDV